MCGLSYGVRFDLGNLGQGQMGLSWKMSTVGLGVYCSHKANHIYEVSQKSPDLTMNPGQLFISRFDNESRSTVPLSVFLILSKKCFHNMEQMYPRSS